MTSITLPSRLYAIVDEEYAGASGWTVVDLAHAYLGAGVRVMQLRAKRASSGLFLHWCDAILEAARSRDSLVIVNDRVDLALLAGASGVHVGQDDLSIEGVRRVLGREAIVGLSTHTLAQCEAGLREPVDYVAVGPVFETSRKRAGHKPVGLELVRDAAALAGARPVVAIGGVTLETARLVIEAGAAAIAVIADLLSGGDPGARARAFLQAVDW